MHPRVSSKWPWYECSHRYLWSARLDLMFTANINIRTNQLMWSLERCLGKTKSTCFILDDLKAMGRQGFSFFFLWDSHIVFLWDFLSPPWTRRSLSYTQHLCDSNMWKMWMGVLRDPVLDVASRYTKFLATVLLSLFGSSPLLLSGCLCMGNVANPTSPLNLFVFNRIGFHEGVTKWSSFRACLVQ